MSFLSSTNTTLRNSITSSDPSSPTITTSNSLDLCSPLRSLLPSIRNTVAPSGSPFVPPLIRIVNSVSSDSPSSDSLCPVPQLSIDALSSSRPRGLRRMSSTGTNLNFFNSSQSNACANALLASPLTGHKRLNPFSLQSTSSNEPIVIGGECGLAEGGTSLYNGRPPSGEKWIAHHLSAVLQHSFSVSSIHPITSVSPTFSPHYLPHQTDLSVIKNNTPLTPADQLRNKSSLTSLSSFAESTTTDDEVDEEVEALSSTSSTESYLQPRTSILPSSSTLDDIESSSCHSTLSSTPRQCISAVIADSESHSSQCVTRIHLLKILDTWSFDANHLSPTQIRHALHVLLSTYLIYTPGFITKLEEIGVSQPENCLTSLVDNLEVAYDPRNAYHNFRHAVDVVQAVYTMLSHQGVVPPLDWVRCHEAGEAAFGQWERVPVGRVGRAMDEITVWALLLAAAGHDVGHPGLSNAFMVNARTPISHVFSDGSVLENFHRITFTRMLRQHGFGKLVDNHAGFRRVIVSSVLATDMGRHFPIVEELKALGKLWEDDESTVEASLDQKASIAAGLIKCGDISNSSRPHHISLTWSSCLLHEWSRQAALENDLHLPVSVVTLDPAEKRAQAKSQIGFTTLFVLPLFSVMETLSPIAFKPFANSCRLGLKTWQKVVEHIDAQKPPTPSVTPIVASETDTPSDVTPTAPSRLTKDHSALVSPRHTLTRIPQVSFATYETSSTSPISSLPLQSSSQSQSPRRSSPLDHKAVDQGLCEDSRHQSHLTDDHLTPRPAQRGWWSSSPSPPFTPNSIGQAPCTNSQSVIRHTLPPVWSDSASSSPKSSSGSSLPSSSHHITTICPAPSPRSTTSDCDSQDVSMAIPSATMMDSAHSKRLLTITVPATPGASINSLAGSTSRTSSQGVTKNNCKVTSAADDSSFSSIGSPSSPSQSPYFTPGVSSASSVESSNDGRDPLVVTLNTDLSHGPPTAPIRQPPSGLGLRVSDRIMRSRDKGMSVDFGLAERRNHNRSSLSQKKKSYSPYLVSQQVACAKGCGKVTAKCVRCGAASKTKMQRSQSLAKPFLFTSTSSRSSPRRQEEDSIQEGGGSPDARSLPSMAKLKIQPNLLHRSSVDEDNGAPVDASSWPPYPFRPTQSPL